MIRKIIHIDMDAFYASIEQRDNPELRGKPVAVGKGSERGVVAAASYEARKYGVHSAMSSKVAKDKCPHLVFVANRMAIYKAVSTQIMEIFLDYTELVEPLSIDEAFMDVTENKKHVQSATFIAREIKERIRETTGLTASAGVSINKFLAKTASDYDKPDGLYVIRPEEAETFVEDLPIEKIHGVGKVTAGKMHRLGIKTGRDLKKQSLAWMNRHFGKVGLHYYNISRAIDERPVNPQRIRKSVGTERTFEKDLQENFEIITALYHIEKELIRRMEKSGSFGRTITLKVKFSDFRQITRSKTMEDPIVDFQTLHHNAKEILAGINLQQKKIRLLGLSLSQLDQKKGGQAVQLELDF
ncbi:MAG: DNA polymerase IV [Bacteroidales bacterium]|nr:DNA polymerase IV [Bacteroidales bacterium]